MIKLHNLMLLKCKDLNILLVIFNILIKALQLMINKNKCFYI